ncbi:3-carboxy-cis,cis-muconate cycloisomerase [Actinocrispum sp. NPDC049592]|uniref:3-carboxy-cis,cis-muconate cycloisomerase n=1 Tax=Actinocrispum sp. NPDC049592 TaxID=3154835 RepID=UPI0034275199
MFDELFGKLDDHDWLVALLDAERALAVVLGRAGLIPDDAARDIARCCSADAFDPVRIGHGSVASGNPVVPLVKRLRSLVRPDCARYVHFGATSQDIMDTAASLVATRALTPVLADAKAAADRCATLADEHRDTLMIARTLMQQALPTVFGLKCAGWLVALDEAMDGLRRVEPAAQLGGAVGTLSVLQDAGIPDAFAAELGLAAPVIPWHTNRTRMGALAGALGVLAGVLGKIALDVTLMAQTEVGEVAEATGGGSSTMPHKQNPTRSVLITAAVRQIPGLVSTMLATMPQEHERAAGNWHAEWETLSSLLRLTGGATARTRDLLDGLRVNPDRMRANLDLTGGLVMAEAISTRVGDGELVAEIARESVASGKSLRECLIEDPRITLSTQDIDAAMDPKAYLGAASDLIDRALRR